MNEGVRICAEIDGVICLSTTEVGRRLGFHVSATFLSKEICKPFAVMSNGTFWAASEMANIRKKLAIYILNGADK